MKDQEHDELWELLGKAKQPAVSPFFARNVLRRLRQEEQPQRPWLAAVWRMLFRPATAAIAALLAMVLVSAVQIHEHSATRKFQAAAAQLRDDDLAVVADLDELLASHDTNLWDDPDSSL